MRLFRVALVDVVGALSVSRYVLAESFDTAITTAVAAQAQHFGSAIATSEGAAVEDLGLPLTWEPPAPVAPPPEAKRAPAVSIKQSITSDYLVCLDDGLKFKSLKRHLSVLGMTPAEYREKWGLPANYPMVAPGYSAVRSELAKANGLGRK